MKSIRAISIINGLLVAFLAACTFILSYDALRQVALAAGVNPDLSYLWPLSLDAFMIAACLTTLRASLQGERAWLAWALIVAFTALSVAFNVSHITPLLPQWLVFALPPAVVFLALELLTMQLRGAILRGNAVQSLAVLQDAIERARNDLVQLETQSDVIDARIAQAGQSGQVAQFEQANQPRTCGNGKVDNSALLAAWRNDPTATDTSLASMIGVSRQAIAQRRVQLERTGAIRRNGNGVEVL